MFAFLEGEFVFKSPAMVHLKTGGVGYEVQISLNTFSRIQHLDRGRLYTYLLVREDAHILYGFFDMAEKEMFQQLLAVSGIGATTARVMLSYLKPEELVSAIITADMRTLEGIKGIGKKTAERMVVELRDKLSRQSPELNIQPMKNNTLHSDALIALQALGVARNTADQVIKSVLQSNPTLTSLEEVIKKALKNL